MADDASLLNTKIDTTKTPAATLRAGHERLPNTGTLHEISAGDPSRKFGDHQVCTAEEEPFPYYLVSPMTFLYNGIGPYQHE